jgi:hypothetical protein
MHAIQFLDANGVNSCHICCELSRGFLKCSYCGRPVCKACADDPIVKKHHSTCTELGSYLD